MVDHQQDNNPLMRLAIICGQFGHDIGIAIQHFVQEHLIGSVVPPLERTGFPAPALATFPRPAQPTKSESEHGGLAPSQPLAEGKLAEFPTGIVCVCANADAVCRTKLLNTKKYHCRHIRADRTRCTNWVHAAKQCSQRSALLFRPNPCPS